MKIAIKLKYVEKEKIATFNGKCLKIYQPSLYEVNSWAFIQNIKIKIWRLNMAKIESKIIKGQQWLNIIPKLT